MSVAAFAALSMLASPGFGANLLGERGAEQRGGAFAGLNIRMALGAGMAKRPDARLKLGVTYRLSAARPGTHAPIHEGSMLELGFAKAGTPLLFVGRRNLTEMERRLGLDGTETTLLIAGGVLLAAGSAALLFADSGPSACRGDGTEESIRCERRLD